jgi:hypothetical protein
MYEESTRVRCFDPTTLPSASFTKAVQLFIAQHLQTTAFHYSLFSFHIHLASRSVSAYDPSR